MGQTWDWSCSDVLPPLWEAVTTPRREAGRGDESLTGYSLASSLQTQSPRLTDCLSLKEATMVIIQLSLGCSTVSNQRKWSS